MKSLTKTYKKARILHLASCILRPASCRLQPEAYSLKRTTRSSQQTAQGSQLTARSLLLIVASLTFLFQSCNRTATEQELTDYIKNPENGVFIEKEVGTVNYKVYYRPSDLLVSQELRAYESKTDSLIDHYKRIYHKNLYFMVSISQNNQEVLNNVAGNRQQFGSMVNQLAFGMDQKVTLISSGKDTLHLLDYVYPRTYGVGKSTDMLFAFENKKINQAEWLQLIIEDFGLQTGDVRFKFLTKDIRKIPNLIFE